MQHSIERIFAEKPRIVLRYPGGISPVELATLPLIIERLQAEHPDCLLHIRSVQDDGSGATVTVTVDDLTGREDASFNAGLLRAPSGEHPPPICPRKPDLNS